MPPKKKNGFARNNTYNPSLASMACSELSTAQQYKLLMSKGYFVLDCGIPGNFNVS